jgi:hypothetical protein
MQGRLSFLNKVIYMGARRFLPIGHELRKQVYNRFFNGETETRIAPKRPSGRFREEQWQRVKDNEVPLNRSGMTKLPGFYQLPYFKIHASISLNLLYGRRCSSYLVMNILQYVIQK